MDATLFVGPQVAGVVILLAGLAMKYYPPKTINGMYGYRTPRSMLNQRNWDEGNKYAANLMIKLSAAAIVVGVLLVLFLPAKLVFISAAVTVVSLIALVITLLTATERHLKNLPDADAL